MLQFVVARVHVDVVAWEHDVVAKWHDQFALVAILGRKAVC